MELSEFEEKEEWGWKGVRSRVADAEESDSAA